MKLGPEELADFRSVVLPLVKVMSRCALWEDRAVVAAAIRSCLEAYEQLEEEGRRAAKEAK